MGFPSAAGLVGFLSEPDHALQEFALEKLNAEIDNIWTEVSASIGQMYVKYNTKDYREIVWRAQIESTHLKNCVLHIPELS